MPEILPPGTTTDSSTIQRSSQDQAQVSSDSTPATVSSVSSSLSSSSISSKALFSSFSASPPLPSTFQNSSNKASTQDSIDQRMMTIRSVSPLLVTHKEDDHSTALHAFDSPFADPPASDSQRYAGATPVAYSSAANHDNGIAASTLIDSSLLSYSPLKDTSDGYEESSTPKETHTSFGTGFRTLDPSASSSSSAMSSSFSGVSAISGIGSPTGSTNGSQNGVILNDNTNAPISATIKHVKEPSDDVTRDSLEPLAQGDKTNSQDKSLIRSFEHKSDVNESNLKEPDEVAPASLTPRSLSPAVQHRHPRRKPIRRVPVSPNQNSAYTFTNSPVNPSSPLVGSFTDEKEADGAGHLLAARRDLNDMSNRRISMALLDTDLDLNISNPYVQSSRNNHKDTTSDNTHQNPQNSTENDTFASSVTLTPQSSSGNISTHRPHIASMILEESELPSASDRTSSLTSSIIAPTTPKTLKPTSSTSPVSTKLTTQPLSAATSTNNAKSSSSAASGRRSSAFGLTYSLSSSSSKPGSTHHTTAPSFSDFFSKTKKVASGALSSSSSKTSSHKSLNSGNTLKNSSSKQPSIKPVVAPKTAAQPLKKPGTSAVPSKPSPSISSKDVKAEIRIVKDVEDNESKIGPASFDNQNRRATFTPVAKQETSLSFHQPPITAVPPPKPLHHVTNPVNNSKDDIKEEANDGANDKVKDEAKDEVKEKSEGEVEVEVEEEIKEVGKYDEQDDKLETKTDVPTLIVDQQQNPFEDLKPLTEPVLDERASTSNISTPRNLTPKASELSLKSNKTTTEEALAAQAQPPQPPASQYSAMHEEWHRQSPVRRTAHPVESSVPVDSPLIRSLPKSLQPPPMPTQATSHRVAASLQSAGLADDPFRDPIKPTSAQQQWSLNAAPSRDSVNISSLHRHAVSNASFDFGVNDTSLQTAATPPVPPSPPPPASPQQQTPRIIRPQPVSARQISTFDTVSEGVSNTSFPAATPAPLSSPFQSSQDQTSNPPSTEPSGSLLRSHTSASLNSQPDPFHSRSSSTHSTKSNQLKPLTSSAPSTKGNPLKPLSSSASPQYHLQGSNGSSSNNLKDLARKISSSSATPSFSQQQRISIASTTAQAAAFSRHHTRLNSTSSRFSRSSVSSESMPSHSKNSGSFYVRELKRRAATTWCDIPPSVWGLPIGLKDTSHITTTTTSSNGNNNNHSSHFFTSSTGGSGYPNGKLKSGVNSVDIRHSHLTPRLLASEVGDDTEDYAYPGNNTSGRSSLAVNAGIPLSTTTTTASTLQPGNDHSEYGIGSGGLISGGSSGSTGAEGTLNNKSSVDIDRYASVTSGASAKSARSRRSNLSSISNVSSSGKDYEQGEHDNRNQNHTYDNDEIAHDTQSIDSVEDGAGKIKLFVMNPDTSSSEDEGHTNESDVSDSD